MYRLFTSLVLEVLASCIPFLKNDPRKYQGRGIIAVLHLFQRGREDMAIADICIEGFGLSARFSLHVREFSP